MEAVYSSTALLQFEATSTAIFQTICVALVSLFILFCCIPAIHTPVRNLVRPFVLHHVESGLSWVSFAQKFQNPLLTFIFRQSSHSVSVPFYGSFLPGLIWLGFPQLGWHLAVLMALTLYVGNAMKDLVSAPRPLGVSDNNSHHIVLLEGESKEAGLNAKEYGLPSSHTMNSVCLNFYLCHYLHEHGILGEKETLITYTLAVVWCTWIAISRIYLGLHSPIDLLAGLIAGFTVLTTFISIESVLEAWIAMGPLFVGLSAALICLILLRLHPRPLHATPTYEFSTSIMGVMFGTTTAVSRFQEYHNSPIRISELGDVHYAWHIRRLMAGFAILMASKVVFRALSFALLPRLYLFFPLKLRRLWQPPVHNQCLPKNMENPALRALPHSPRGKPFDVEMTARFFAYAGIGLGAAELAPRVFTFVGW